MHWKSAVSIASGENADSSLLHEISYAGIVHRTVATVAKRQSASVVDHRKCHGVMFHNPSKDFHWRLASTSNVNR